MLKQSSLQTASVKCARIAPPADILLQFASAENTHQIFVKYNRIWERDFGEFQDSQTQGRHMPLARRPKPLAPRVH